jgi:hypothetical protein
VDLNIVAAMITALANLATEAIKGQTPEQRALIWQRHIDLHEHLMKLFRIEAPKGA